MASTKFCKRDRNRLKKVYPFVQRKPSPVMQSEKNVDMEANEIFIENLSEFRYDFMNDYDIVPTVTATLRETDPNSDGLDASVSIMIKNITKKFVDFTASQAFSGSVFIQVIAIY